MRMEDMMYEGFHFYTKGAEHNKWMETNIREDAHILVLCITKLKEKANLRIGGIKF